MRARRGNAYALVGGKVAVGASALTMEAMQWREHFSSLRIDTPTVQLRVADDDMLAELGEVAASALGTFAEDQSPFRTRWDQLDADERCTLVVKRQRDAWATFDLGTWRLPLAVRIDGKVAGEVTLTAQRFRAQPVFSTASWLAEAVRGRGFGTEVRMAALQFGFGALAATRALSQSFADNAASIGVSKALSYQLSGATMYVDPGRTPRRLLHYRLDRRMWEARVRRGDIVVTGMCTHFP